MEWICKSKGKIDNLNNFNTCNDDSCDFCNEIDSLVSDALFEGKFSTADKKDSFVYLMYDESYYKIGRSVDPEKRCVNLRVSNLNIKLLAYGKGTTEKTLHKEYENHRVGGEWFDLTDKQVSDIISKIE